MYSQQASLQSYMEGGHGGNASQNQMFQSYSAAQAGGGHPGSMGLGKNHYIMWKSEDFLQSS